jgi:hypothetical protein
MPVLPDKPPTPERREVAGRYFLRASIATQIKNPIVKIAKPTNAMACSKLALSNENAVCASMVSFS